MALIAHMHRSAGQHGGLVVHATSQRVPPAVLFTNLRSLVHLRIAIAAIIWSLVVTHSAASELDGRSLTQFNQWRSTNASALDVDAFAAFLEAEGVANVMPMHQVLRSASSWRKCGGQPFAVPPRANWPATAKTLRLLKELKSNGLISEHAEIASGFRPRSIATCADSEVSSAHTTAYAVDLYGSAKTASGICKLWKSRGQSLDFGLSKYQSGRIHVDASGYRTWGNDCTCETSYCKSCLKSKSKKCRSP